ncbi:MAG: GNAT family N-acetyltransferase [Microscillaceae bacterium]|jgi:GNAT superfamily N-acetyltransferase|nr:GNAT family N-acetyltransferase [Microscillaceae bacterium]
MNFQTNNFPFTVRVMLESDVPAVLGLVRELAEYEKAPHEVSNTEAQMRIDGFGDNPLFGGFVAEMDKKVVGMAIYYYRYSTWKGRVLYLEDIYVQEAYRRHKIGFQLLKACIAQAHADHCARMTWQVLDWNEPAIKFYEKLNAHFDNEWVNVFVNKDQFADFLAD